MKQAETLPVPSGIAHIKIQGRGTGEVRDVSLSGQVENPKPLNALDREIKAKAPIGYGDMCSEKSRIIPPSGATIVSGVPFTAYTFSTTKGRVGPGSLGRLKIAMTIYKDGLGLIGLLLGS